MRVRRDALKYPSPRTQLALSARLTFASVRLKYAKKYTCSAGLRKPAAFSFAVLCIIVFGPFEAEHPKGYQDRFCYLEKV